VFVLFVSAVALPVVMAVISILIGRYIVESSHARYKDEPRKRFLDENVKGVSEKSVFDMNPVPSTDVVDNH